MTRFQVDSDEVAAATANVRATSARIQSDVAQMHSRLLELQSSWSGAAATGFQGVVAEWTATQQRVDESLATIAQALDQAGRTYAEVEAQNARLFAG
ncbi:MAG: WXG100 family type VII secretion target [Micrococcales bacterium]|nr:WXG100 family type VII secretion target [Micrococcales bacterium]